MQDVVRDCLENAQAIRQSFREYDDVDIEPFRGFLGERLGRQERMMTYLLAALALRCLFAQFIG